MRSNTLAIVASFAFVISACRDENVEKETAPRYIVAKIEKISLASGSQYIVQYMGGYEEGERIRLTSDAALFQWVNLTDALTTVAEEDRFICGLAGSFPLAAKIGYKMELNKGQWLELTFPKENDFVAFDDPTLAIRSLSPSPLFSFVLDQKTYHARETYLENRESTGANTSSWNENIETLEAKTRLLIDEFNHSSQTRKAEMAMNSAYNYMRMFGISEGWETLFSTDRDWLAWQAARAAVEKASTFEGDASEQARSILLENHLP